MNKLIKIFSWILFSFLFIYAITALSFSVFQNRFIFQSKSLSPEYAFAFGQNFEEHFITTEDQEKLSALLFKTSQPSKGLILYFHGNADNLQRWGMYAVDFTQLGFDVLMIDYRGYGKSTGTPTEENLYKDAVNVLQWSQKNYSPTRTIIYGRSLGAAVASHLATVYNPELLILETPFDELSGAVYPIIRPVLQWFPQQYRFSNKATLPKVTCRTLIIHGTDDWVVPLSSALRLKPLLKEGDQFIIIKGGGHRNLRDFEEFHTALAEALK